MHQTAMRVFLPFLIATAVFGADPPPISLHRVATGFESPVDIRFPPDGSGRMFVVEQSGRIRIVRNGVILEAPFLDLRSRVSTGGERGLLGLAFPPGFGGKRYFYVNYTDRQGATVVSRIRVSGAPDVADADSEQEILRVAQPQSNHNGGNLAFGPDGYLYIGLGDGGGGGDPNNFAQRTDTLLGKMLRIDVEFGQEPYRIPPGNPFADRTGFRPEIWATGLRNPWRYSFDRQTGDLWIADVGQNRAEEVNFQAASSRGGENYGWRRMEGQDCYPAGSACDRSGLTLPVVEYQRQQGVSVTGGFVYRGARYPALRGFYLYGDFGSGNLWALQRTDTGWDNRLVLASGRNLSTFGEDDNGELYVAHHGGDIYLIVAGPPAISAGGVVNAASFAPGVSAGSLASIFGRGLTALPGIIENRSVPIPTQLAGVSVTMNGIRAPIMAVAALQSARQTIEPVNEQINLQVPYEVAGASSATVVVTANGQASAPFDVAIVNTQPEIFAITRSSSGITIWATGLGPVQNAPSTGQLASASPLSSVAGQTVVTVGGATAAVTYSGLAPGFAGLYQVNATIPESAAAGAPVVVSVGGSASRPSALP